MTISRKTRRCRTCRTKTVKKARTVKRMGINRWRGWKQDKPGYHQKTAMLQKCGKKCFLGPERKFPICKKNTCKIDKRGVWAAYVRAKQYHHPTIAQKARKLLMIL